MTCPYYSIQDGKPFCSGGRILDPNNLEKLDECMGSYGRCLSQTLDFQKKEIPNADSDLSICCGGIGSILNLKETEELI